MSFFTADSWPQSLDASGAAADWGWQHEFDLSKVCDVMLAMLKKELHVGEESDHPKFFRAHA